MMNETESVKKELKKLADPARAKAQQRFFKTGPGEYGEGDRFMGVRVPPIRRLVRKFRGISMESVDELLASPWHEERLFALIMMTDIFKRGSDGDRSAVYGHYMGSTEYINSWDLVDVSAPHVPGAFLWKRDRGPLFDLAESHDLWERRIAIVATQHFIRNNDFSDTLKISEMLLKDQHDLIHKAVGWMLREVGKRDMETEESFLRKHCSEMPRTMLRYAIERFPEDLRQSYLRGEVR